jgi:purine catabolism regulator
MGLTIKDALNMLTTVNIHVIAGETHLDRNISSVNIIEVPTVSDWMKGGELVFTSGYAFQGNMNSACEIISDLYDSNVAALVIKPSKYLPEIPRQIIDCAETLGFPLLQIPEDMPYSIIMQPISEKIINTQLDSLRNIESAHSRLMMALLEGKSIASICEILSDLISQDVYLYDKQFQIISSSQNNRENSEEITNMISKSLLNNEEAMFECNAHHWASFFSELINEEIIYIPLDINRVRTAFLIVRINNKPLLDYDYIAMENAGTVITHVIQQQQALLEKEWQLRGECLDDLIWRNYSDINTALGRAQFFGVDLTKDFCIFVIDRSKSELMQSQSSVNDIAQDFDEIERLRDSIRRSMSYANYPILIQNKVNTIVILVELPNNLEYRITKTKICSLLTETVKRYVNENFIIGVSKVHNSISEVKTAYKESITAIKCGYAIKNKTNHVFFDDMGVFSFLYELQDSESAQTFFDQKFGALMKYDNEKDGDLLNTLKTYFNSNCNIQKTAEALFLHKNSVIYRLHKIEQLTHSFLNDRESTFQLQLCIKLMSFLEI